jgi:hypothetical protein
VTPSVAKYAPSTASADTIVVPLDQSSGRETEADEEMLLKDVCALRTSSKSGFDIEPRRSRPPYGLTTKATRSGSRTPSPFRKIASTIE